jgi:hypothetical protein
MRRIVLVLAVGLAVAGSLQFVTGDCQWGSVGIGPVQCLNAYVAVTPWTETAPGVVHIQPGFSWAELMRSLWPSLLMFTAWARLC